MLPKSYLRTTVCTLYVSGLLFDKNPETRFLSKLKPLSPDTPSLIRGALKLATKYQIDDIRKAIIERLESDWPQTLGQWDALEAHADALTLEYRANGPVEGLYPDDQLPEPASAIRLARECNIPSILPAAFYHLSRLSPGNDWDKAHASRGDVSGVPQAQYQLGLRTAKWCLLDTDDFMCLLRAKEVESNEIAMAPLKLRFQLQTPTLCSDGCLTQATVMMGWWHPFDPLRYLDEKFGVGELTRRGVCAKCAPIAQKHAQERRENFWRNFPASCGITGKS